jgi:lysyl-tRNA synthetase, class II
MSQQNQTPNKSFSSVDTQREIRITKLDQLKARGIDPFIPHSRRDMTLLEVKNLFETESKLLADTSQKTTIAGRVKSKRVGGQIAFAQLEDESLPSGFQVIFKADILVGERLELGFIDFKQLIDEGDYLQLSGYLDRSKSGEPSLFVESFNILTKSLRPLPEKLEDIEQIYRQRYLDMRLNPEVREMFRMKSRFWSSTRQFMVENNFTELQAPTMEETTGGAEASPFVTHHNSLDEDYFLRISSELHLKRYIVGGFEKVFDIDKNFRNEGIDDEHLQEFTQMEFYWAYASDIELMNYCEKLMKHVIKETFGTMILRKDDKDIDWSKPWPRVPYYEFIEQYSGIKLDEYETVEQLQTLAKELGVHFEYYASKGRLIDQIYKKVARPKCIEPIWLTHIPVELSPLAKRDPKNPSLTLRSHLLAYGSELSNGFSELNDPIDQLNRFVEQQQYRDGGDDEAMMIDHDYVQALEIGMPPTAGFAYSERLFSVLMQKPIRETTAFPLMKRKENNSTGKSKKTMVAHCVLLDTPEVPNWSKLNTAAHLSASFASREGKKLIHIDSTKTTDGETILMNIQYAIIMKSTDDQIKLVELKKLAEKAGLVVSCFTEEMQSSSNDEKVKAKQEVKSIDEIGFLGILVFGKKSKVEELTSGYNLAQ